MSNGVNIELKRAEEITGLKEKENSDYFCLSQQWADIHLKTSNIWTTVNSWFSLPGIWTVTEATKQEIPYCAGGLCKSVMEYLKHLISNTVNPFGGKDFEGWHENNSLSHNLKNSGQCPVDTSLILLILILFVSVFFLYSDKQPFWLTF